MYEQHFGLKNPPFAATPDPSFYVNLAGHHEAINTLVVALRSGEAIVKIVGEVGTGKSMLCQKLLQDLGRRFVIAYLPYPALSPKHIQQDLAQELGVALPPDADSHQILRHLKEVLIDIRKQGRRCVVMVDEAQTLPDATLECVRLLSNLELSGQKLLQIVLVGQPELDLRINHPRLRQLQQRIAFSHKLMPIDQATTEAYLKYRLRIAGYMGPPLFSSWAIRAIHRASGGILRIINILAHKALMCAYGHGDSVVYRYHVRRAIADSESIRGWRSKSRRGWFTRRQEPRLSIEDAAPRIYLQP